MFKQSGCDIIGVKRCYHRISSRRMPSVKIFHKYNKDLIKSTNADILHTFKGRKAFIEPQRSNRVIRCYQCMRFAHIASCCWFDPKCENCGQSSHSREECKKTQNVQTVREIIVLRPVNVPCIWRNSKPSSNKILCNKMRLLQLNCQSLRTAKKDISNITDQYNIDILCLTESGNRGGVAIVQRQSENFVFERCNDFGKDNLEVICSKVKIRGNEEFMLIVGYIPPSQKECMKEFTNVLNSVCAQHRNVIVAGDFNAKSSSWGNVENNQAGEYFDTCLDENNLLCLNDYQPTYRHSNSVIDLFVIKPYLSAKVKLCQTLTHECVRSDHISVLLDFDDGQQEDVIKREQYNIRKTSMNEWKLITDERFKKWNESWEKMPDQDIDEVWDSFLQVFRE